MCSKAPVCRQRKLIANLVAGSCLLWPLGGRTEDWVEPEVTKKEEGRDEEARRRLTVVETQLRKLEAEKAKKEAEEKQRPHFDFSGKYKARINSRNNFNLDNPLQEWRFDNETFFDQRYQLQVDATYESLQATLLLDKGNFVFDWKEDGEGTLERWGEFQLVNAPLVRQLFVQHTGDFVFRVGRQNWDVGHSIVLEGPMDSARVQYPLGKLPWGTTTASVAYMSIAGGWSSYTKFRETGPPAGARGDVLGATNKLDGYYLDLDIRPSRKLKLVPYLLKVSDRGRFGNADLNLDKDFDAATLPRDGYFEPLWTGLAVDGELAGLKIGAEGVLLSGDYANGRKVNANALLVRIEYPMGGKQPTEAKPPAGETGHGHGGGTVFGLEAGRGSGNETDDAPAGTVRDFSSLFLCRDRHKFGNIFSEDLRAGYFLWDSNLGNVTYLKLYLNLEPAKNLKITPSVAQIWTTESVFKGRGPVGDWSRGASTSTGKAHDVGWEADLNVTFPILDRLEGFISLGYFQPGDVYARADGRGANPATEVVVGSEFKF